MDNTHIENTIPNEALNYEQFKSKIARGEKSFTELVEGLTNHNIVKNIVHTFRNSSFHFLDSERDKIKELTSLISPHLPMKKLDSFLKKDASHISDEKTDLITKNQIQLENLYTTSLLTDAINRKQSALTEQLREYVVDSTMSLMKLSEREIPSKQDISKVVNITIDEPISKICEALEFGKEKGFLSRLLDEKGKILPPFIS